MIKKGKKEKTGLNGPENSALKKFEVMRRKTEMRNGGQMK